MEPGNEILYNTVNDPIVHQGELWRRKCGFWTKRYGILRGTTLSLFKNASNVHDVLPHKIFEKITYPKKTNNITTTNNTTLDVQEPFRLQTMGGKRCVVGVPTELRREYLKWAKALNTVLSLEKVIIIFNLNSM